ncbi:Slam-dependent surface lipoprotein [Luteimonas sp. R10]|uniref:Slam-dependent surface lipoprotein n=1 Tax=Luteimonas sp. R10 TaxID=3108176 RepID=UPI00308DC8DF|nr:Slam-dependent surface lipoprotein [Luteimonas sp. R10]
MKTIHRIAALAAAVSISAIAGAAQAAVVGASSPPSDPNYAINVGVSEVGPAGPHKPGWAGIGVSTYASGQRVDFDGLLPFTTKSEVNIGANVDGDALPTTRVHSLAFPITGSPPSHSGLGYFNFIQVAASDVYIGEWSSNGSAGGFSHRQVYYVGNDAGTTVPTSGTASYSVAGVNQFTGSNLLSGTFNVNFGAGTLSGNLSRTGLNIAVGATFAPGSALFSGAANANSGAAAGTVQGRFFGANAASLAGIANFGAGSQYNTAFGGTKN